LQWVVLKGAARHCQDVRPVVQGAVGRDEALEQAHVQRLDALAGTRQPQLEIRRVGELKAVEQGATIQQERALGAIDDGCPRAGRAVCRDHCADTLSEIAEGAHIHPYGVGQREPLAGVQQVGSQRGADRPERVAQVFVRRRRGALGPQQT